MTRIWTTRGFNGSKLWGLIVFSRVGRKKEFPTMRSCGAVSPVLTRSTHTCSGDESASLRASSCSETSTNCTVVRRGVSILVEARLHLLRRTEWADRDDACGIGREKTLDRQFAISARAEFLHAASRPGGTATSHLHRLALAQNPRRHCRRRIVCYPLDFYFMGTFLLFRRVWSRSLDCRGLLWIETGRPRDRRRRRHSHREQGPEELYHVDNRGRGFRRGVFFSRPISRDCRDRGRDWIAWRENSTAIFSRRKCASGGCRSCEQSRGLRQNVTASRAE